MNFSDQGHGPSQSSDRKQFPWGKRV